MQGEREESLTDTVAEERKTLFEVGYASDAVLRIRHHLGEEEGERGEVDFGLPRFVARTLNDVRYPSS